MNDKSIREILISWLQATNHEIRIYQEKSIGASICDVMAVTDKLTGYEIKSDQDNYARLQDQVKAYDRFFDENAHEDSYILLIANQPADLLYRKHRFEYLPENKCGMLRDQREDD